MTQHRHNEFRYEQDEALKVRYLQIEPTNLCNLDCQFCSRSTKGQRKKDLSLAELRHIIEPFDAVEFVKLQGLGECFFAQGLPELLGELRARYPAASLMSSTNLCYTRSDEYLGQVLDRLDLLYLSIDGGTKETFERVRAGSRWGLAMATLEQLCRLKRPHNTFSISFVASGENYEELPLVVEMARRLPIDEVRVNPVQDWTSDNRFTRPGDYQAPGFVEELGRWARADDPLVTVVGDPDFEYTKCVWPFERLYVDVYGNVFVCVISLDDRWSQGNLFEQSFEEIYRGPGMSAIREGLRSNRPHPHCQTCSYRALVPTLRKIKGAPGEPAPLRLAAASRGCVDGPPSGASMIGSVAK